MLLTREPRLSPLASQVARKSKYRKRSKNILCGEGAVVHEQEVNVVDVVDEEGLVARGHHVLGLLVGAIADLQSSQKHVVSTDFPTMPSTLAFPR